MGFCEDGKETSGSIKCEKFLEELSDSYFLRRTLFYEVS
jgi:hypothetical protein